MRAKVDPVKCEGFGPCNEVLPEIFKLDEWNYAFVEGDGEVPEELEEKAREAEAGCPVHAITLEP
jgi:ferredoxin